jgi:hypothetical protein
MHHQQTASTSKLVPLASPLLRAFSQERFAVDFVQGKLRFGLLERYRQIEDGSRQDRSEGYGHFLDAQNQAWHVEFGGPIYVLCFSRPEVEFKFLRDRMGLFVVRLGDPVALARDVETYMASHGIRTFNGVHGRPVEYNKGMVVSRELDAMQRAILSVTQKPAQYRQECEYRLFTIVNQHPQSPVAEFVNIDLGAPIQSAELLTD